MISKMICSKQVASYDQTLSLLTPASSSTMSKTVFKLIVEMRMTDAQALLRPLLQQPLVTSRYNVIVIMKKMI